MTEHEELSRRYLDGELSAAEQQAWLSGLSEEERAALADVRHSLQALEGLPCVEPPQELADRVMAAIASRKPSKLAAVRGWWQHRPWHVAGVALAAAVLFAVVGPLVRLATRTPGMPTSPVTEMARAPAAPGLRSAEAVTFTLYAPAARRVALVGDFNGWGSAGRVELQPRSGGVWGVTVKLRPGQYQYAFVVNGGQWVTDPHARQQVSDDFGRRNAVVVVV